MKFTLKGNKWNTKSIILASFGGCVSILGFLMYALTPLQLLVDKLIILQPGSVLYNLWTHPPYEVLAKIYVFNVTNSEQFLAGKEKLNVSEIGPFVYQEILRNTNGHFNENNTLTFKPRRELILRRDLSIDDPEKTMIVSPNIPLLGISSYIKEQYGYFVNWGFARIVSSIESPPMKNLTAADYLFGYKDPLVSLASTYVPSWIDFSEFGIVDRFMAVDNADNTVTIHLPETTSNHTYDTNAPLPYSINTFNGSPGLRHWGYEENDNTKNSICNTIEGAFDAGLFPRLLKENTTLRLYRRAFCRSVSMKYENKSYTSGGLEYYNYRVDQDFLSTANENSDNECYCTTNECLPKGFGSVAPCYYGMPIIMSQPHYLNADPKMLEEVNGLHPDKEKHDTVMKVNPNFGIPLSANLRIQINLKVSDNQIVGSSKPFQGKMVPLFWLELGIHEIPSYLRILLHIADAIPTIEIVTACILCLLGISLIATSWLFMCYSSPQIRFDDPFENRTGYSPILTFPLQQHIRADIRRIS